MPALTALNLACGLSLTDEACDVNSMRPEGKGRS